MEGFNIVDRENDALLVASYSPIGEYINLKDGLSFDTPRLAKNFSDTVCGFGFKIIKGGK